MIMKTEAFLAFSVQEMAYSGTWHNETKYVTETKRDYAENTGELALLEIKYYNGFKTFETVKQ